MSQDNRDEILRIVSDFRSKQRIPVICFEIILIYKIFFLRFYRGLIQGHVQQLFDHPNHLLVCLGVNLCKMKSLYFNVLNVKY